MVNVFRLEKVLTKFSEGLSMQTQLYDLCKKSDGKFKALLMVQVISTG